MLPQPWSMSPSYAHSSMTTGLPHSRAPLVGVLRGPVDVDALHAGVRDPRAAVVVEARGSCGSSSRWPYGSCSRRSAANRSQSAASFDHSRSYSLASDHQTSGYAASRRDDVAQVPVVGGGPDVGEAPPVVGVEEDQVGLDAELAQLADALLQVAEERRVRAARSPTRRRASRRTGSGSGSLAL